MRLGGRTFELMALIEVSRAVASEDEILSRVWQGRIIDGNRQSGTRLPRYAKPLAPTMS
jgi:DNA-binding winged helix-turn-helix (wHTH) protein